MRRPSSSKLHARLAAQAIVRHGFKMKDAAAELRPDLKAPAAYGAKLLTDPDVQHEVEKIMNRTERNATKFVKLMWDWLEKESSPDEVGNEGKEANERRLTAARILAKGYINEKSQPAEASRPMVIEGLGEGIGSLVGDMPTSMKSQPDRKKLM